MATKPAAPKAPERLAEDPSVHRQQMRHQAIAQGVESQVSQQLGGLHLRVLELEVTNGVFQRELQQAYARIAELEEPAPANG